jgi:hypothetical protein
MEKDNWIWRLCPEPASAGETPRGFRFSARNRSAQGDNVNRVIEHCKFAGPSHGRHDWFHTRDYILVCPGDGFWKRLLSGFREYWPTR